MRMRIYKLREKWIRETSILEFPENIFEQNPDREIRLAYLSEHNSTVVLGGTTVEQEKWYYLVGRDGRERIYVPKKFRYQCNAYCI